ncbi:hypothetical protein KTE91_33185 [Burkholderia multivorans]|uniref:hypothetical protein n=1 Tax=Burkholderia multivorans TaxID=87883 RepID=UPI001C250993|nr:hypothetical protein [Burkholderia multivorans]MBU9439931.1 hypothetical protein [Burkholderia multivorans]
MNDFTSPVSGRRVAETQYDSHKTISLEEFCATKRMVMACFDGPAVLLTREDIAARTNLKLSSVCGRVRELLDDGRLEKRGSRKCIATGKAQELIGLPVADPGRLSIIEAA